MSLNRIQPGFSDPIHQAQQVFRQVLDAMAHPGSVQTLKYLPQAAPGLSPAATAACLTLADFETPLWLGGSAAAARSYLVFHCGSPITQQQDHAAFAVAGSARDLDGFEGFNLGSEENPESAATLIVEVTELREGTGATLAGPGIRDHAKLRIDGVAASFWQLVANNHALFPRGIDLILTCGERIAALPRSVRVLAED
jgi:alpha-D-ribose 1-methylphosphonate 5-triphosphate synthase subunit PhnH